MVSSRFKMKIRSSKYQGALLLGGVLFLMNSFTAYSKSHAVFQAPQKKQTVYEKGITEIRDGNWKQALILWSDYLEHDSKEKKSSPEMAFKYIETVTKHHYYQDYPKASTYYLKTFEYASWDNQPGALINEIERIMPIVPRKLEKIWNDKIQEKDPSLFKEVAYFWDIMDPILSTAENERLLEHWERIDYARENYTRTHSTIYGTDDRGLIYVKYGVPQQKTEAKIMYQNTTNPVTGLPVTVGNGMVIQPHIPIIMQVEMWEYTFSNRSEPSYYIFGRDKNTGPFGLQPGILNMIPSMGYTLPSAGLDRQGGSLMVKYGMLSQLIGSSGYFENLYMNLTSDIIMNSNQGTMNAAVFQAPNVLQKFEDKEIRESHKRDRQSPSSTTGLVTANNIIPVQFKIYRLLNKHNQTTYVLSAISNLKKFHKRLAKQSRKNGTAIQLGLSSSLTMYNVAGKKKIFRAPLQILPDTHVEEPEIIMFKTNRETQSLFFGMDLRNLSKYEILQSDKIVLDAPLVGSSGPIRFLVPPELSEQDMPKFTVSDILIGREQELNEKSEMPFNPVANPVFLENEEVIVYFEAYHLPKSEYSVEYRFEKYQGNAPDSKLRPYKAKAAVTVQYKDVRETDKEWFRMRLDDMPPGWYDMVMTLNSHSNAPKIERRFRMKIIKNQD